MKLTIITLSLLLITGCNSENPPKLSEPRTQNVYMVRYNVSGVPEISTTDKIYWVGTTAIKFVDQNGVPRTVSGGFEIIHLSEM